MKKWNALYVASRSEKKVLQRLSELGIEAYVPLKKEIRQWSDRRKQVIVPLINGYVFIRVTKQERDLVFRANGVVNYVRSNGKDAVIRDEEILILKSIEEKGYFVEANPINDFNVGDRTIINYGQFKGLKGIIERVSNKDVCTILLESLGYSLRINIEKEVLELLK